MALAAREQRPREAKGVEQRVEEYPLEAGNHLVQVVIPPEMRDEDPAGSLARFIVNISFKDLPSDVIERVKVYVLDTLGVMLAGSGQEGVSPILKLVKEWKGAPQSRILLFGDKVPAPHAAFAMGVMARALDLGTVNDHGMHVDEYLMPSTLAVSDWLGNVSGKNFIVAYALGHEVSDRIGAATFSMSYALKAGSSQHDAVWGPTCAVCKLLDLNADAIWNAIGIVYSALSPMDYQASLEGNLMKRIQHCFACMNGVLCPLLAKEGITGTRQVFSGIKGYLHTQYPWKNDIEALTKGLGEEWLLRDTNIKFYSCCLLIHGAISGCLELKRKHGLKAADVKDIKILVPPQAASVVEPREIKWNPQTMPAAQFSLPFCVATGFIKERVSLVDFTAEEIKNKNVHDLMRKIDVSYTSKLKKNGTAKVKIVTKDGRPYYEEILAWKGSTEKPVTFDEEAEKFIDCAKFTIKTLPKNHIEQVIDMVRNLEKVDNICKIVDLLTVQ